MPAPAPWAPCHSSRWRRFVSAIRAALVMVFVLCAVMHGVAEETHASVAAPAASSALNAGGEPHGPHGPHGPHETEGCVADAFVRSAAQSTEELSLGLMAVALAEAEAVAVAVLVALSVGLGGPLLRHGLRRRRSARSGRVALVRTSRWRI
ncbi:hypothetical protein [Streptomyces sp. UG1]|uniref:hypothetical protein n=1 Tax=Streptomyces sp. UG1 TaxID=3417652 RepID=UPI003CEA6394